MTAYKEYLFPKTRLATIDVMAAGRRKHHIAGLLELDVTEGKIKIKEINRNGDKISFTSWLIKVICQTIKEHETVAAFQKGKRKLIVFNDINVSLIVEKVLDGHKIPVPLIIEKASDKTLEEITVQIRDAKNSAFTEKDIVLHKRSSRMERLYYLLPGFIRRYFWSYLLSHPHFAFGKMGNVGLTSIGMIGNVSGWFIPSSIHPICFGVSSVVKKPRVINDVVVIRDVLNMTVLLDHDVIDGAPMARFISDLSGNIEKAMGM